jgi:hypothetical protein
VTTSPTQILGRYLNLGGATVEVVDRSVIDSGTTLHIGHAACGGHGCNAAFTAFGDQKITGHPDVRPTDDKLLRRTQDWAQRHAAECRAMTRPGTHPVHIPPAACDSTDPDNPEIHCKYPADHTGRCRAQGGGLSFAWQRPAPEHKEVEW